MIMMNVQSLVKSFEEIKKKSEDLRKKIEKEQRIQELSNEIDKLKQELEELQDKSYEISYPDNGTEVYFINDYYGDIAEREYDAFDKDYKHLYDTGLYFDTEEEAEQFKREQTLIKKIKCWTKEQQGDWKPDWSENTLKYDIYCHYGIEKELKISDVYYINDIKKLPYFKSKEIAQACINEFGDEILEVFC